MLSLIYFFPFPAQLWKLDSTGPGPKKLVNKDAGADEKCCFLDHTWILPASGEDKL